MLLVLTHKTKLHSMRKYFTWKYRLSVQFTKKYRGRISNMEKISNVEAFTILAHLQKLPGNIHYPIQFIKLGEWGGNKNGEAFIFLEFSIFFLF